MYKETKEEHFKLAYSRIRKEIQRDINQAKATFLFKKEVLNVK